MIIPNTARDLHCHVVTLATGLDHTAGTVYAYVWRDSDGYFLKADNTWVTPAPAGANIPTATHVVAGVWKVNLIAAVTNALTPGEKVSCRMTDHETPASATVTSDTVEHLVDALTNTRLATAGYTAPDNAGIANAEADASTAATQATAAAIASARAVALLGDNTVLESLTQNVDGQMLTGELRAYDSAANAVTDDGVTGLLFSYDIVQTYTAGLPLLNKTTRG